MPQACGSPCGQEQINDGGARGPEAPEGGSISRLPTTWSVWITGGIAFAAMGISSRQATSGATVSPLAATLCLIWAGAVV